MAEGDDTSPDRFRKKTVSYDDATETEDPIKLDIGIDLSKNFERATSMEDNFGASTSGVNEPPKREDNPFSFKHFLRNDSTNYQNQGARPKVYCDGRPISSVSDLDLHQMTEGKQTRIVPEFSSALPDFVQDHLVIEQCYLNKDLHKTYDIDVDNLPDFTPSRTSVNINRVAVDSSRDVDRRCSSNSSSCIPFDLPIRAQASFPLDLPMGDSQTNVLRSCPSSAEVGVSKSLPDFLADGAVQTCEIDVSTAGHSPERDMDRLQQDLDHCRRQLSEQNRRSEHLQQELEIARNKEHEYTQSLAKALEQVEENLERSNRRATIAESSITKLQQEIKALTFENNILKRENNNLRGEEGASGGPSVDAPNELHSRKLAQELRTAASTAEHSLRQLLTGLDNLRIMASSLENMHRIQERTEYVDLDHDTGPTL